ncbi:alkaline phosphatase family protein [Aureibaculum conchae]|uniref:alkaline phosphatase family protein n=1 Tax=Aureibaculum sp. 2308TA14-22 TaxID=3108392 RepID=UPI003399D0C9
MNFKRIITGLFIIVVSLTCYSQKKKAILIGIDGLQYEKIAKINTPNLDKLNIKKGYTGGVHGTDSQQITSSGPSWMTILTGVWTNQHKIIDNTKDKLCQSPSIFNFIREHNKDAYTTSISTWKNINIFLKDDMYKTNFSSQGGNDVLSTELVINQINDYNSDFSFVHLDDVDHAGHAYGFGEKHDKTVAFIDGLVGEILKTIKVREHKYHEDWLIMIVTDHGRDTKGFGHGAQEINQKTIFIGMNKEGNTIFKNSDNDKKINSFKDLETLIPQTAVVPTILKHLKVPIKKEWNLDAKPLID